MRTDWRRLELPYSLQSWTDIEQGCKTRAKIQQLSLLVLVGAHLGRHQTSGDQATGDRQTPTSIWKPQRNTHPRLYPDRSRQIGVQFSNKMATIQPQSPGEHISISPGLQSYPNLACGNILSICPVAHAFAARKQIITICFGLYFLCWQIDAHGPNTTKQTQNHLLCPLSSWSPPPLLVLQLYTIPPFFLWPETTRRVTMIRAVRA